MASSPMIKTGATLAIAGAAGAAFATSAMAQNATIYGHLNPSVITVDDGVESYDEFVDNSHSSSRFGVDWANELGDGTLKFKFETSLGWRGSSSIDQNGSNEFWNYQRTSLRKFEFSYESGWGKVSVGQGSMATDGAAGSDLSGTTLIGSTAIGDMAGSFQFRDAAGNLTGTEISDVFDDFDGSRLGRVRYDTPEFGGGFTVAFAVGENILSEGNEDLFYDTAVYYSGETAALEYEAGFGVGVTDPSGGGSTTTDLVGSFSAIHKETGINGTIALGDSEDAADYIYAKAGIKRDWFDWGTTALSVDVMVSNLDANDAEGTAWGVQAVQKIDAYNVEVYAGYRDHSFEDNTGSLYQDISAFQLGARWKF